MATTASNVKDESQATNDNRGDISGKIDEQDAVLQMVDTGFDEERVFESREYQFAMDMLEDPKLKDNEMYRKLTRRLSAFYLQTEKIRINGGLSAQQQETITKSGFSHAFRIKLHKCLRELLIHIVNEKMMDIKLKQLRQTY